MRRNAVLVAVVALAAALSLGGCSLFKSSDAKKAEAAKEAAPEIIYAPVETVRGVEIGTTRGGYVITAQGYAPGLGYGAGELRPRREGKPGLDGYLDYDFVVRAPDPGLNLGTGEIAARAVRADLHVKAVELRGAQGIRVHGVSGGVQMSVGGQ